jgi:hypothetical protein
MNSFREQTMKRLQHVLAQAALTLLVAGGAVHAADDPCAGFKWDVARERGLFAGKAMSERAGTDVTQAPAIEPELLYELMLTRQDQVHFQAPPGKAPRTGGTFAGLLRLKVSKPGLYRISVDQPFWIDVASGTELVHSTDYAGAAGCSAPNKIVQYLLPAGRDLMVQISGLQSAQARLTVTFATNGA